MSHPVPSTSSLQPTEQIGQRALTGESEQQKYASFFCEEDEEFGERLIGGLGGWVRGRWWYTLAHVCQRWRNVILGSASYLGVSLVCTEGTPVADMLAHSPPLPLVIDYRNVDHGITADDEEGAILALRQRDRVRRVRFEMPATNLQELIVAIDEEYPILEYLVIVRLTEGDSMILTFPETLQVPHLRHLMLFGFTLPIGSRLLTTAVGLVTLCLVMDHPSTYFHPNTLLRWLSSMPQLETLAIIFLFPVPNRDIERQFSQTPIITPFPLHNLHHFCFQGVSTYLEALVHRITTPRLEMLAIYFFHQLTFSVPRLLQFLNTTENLRFESAKFEFLRKDVYVKVYPRGEAEMYALALIVHCWHLDWQVSSAAQISDALSRIFSEVEHLTLEHKEHSLSSEEHNEVDRSEWRKLLGSFWNAKTLRIDDGLVGELSRCLQLEDGELPLELLPELEELTCSGSGDTGDGFTSFIDARQNAGRPVTLVRSSNQRPSEAPVEASTVTSSEAGDDVDT
ncbi:hypothetical protein DFH94DRAFT_816366 [Russula ochroleuca]|uniref:Uncharacterized protein n=1 Tax=Russula ochroleuca TaxID=152965 RepID=A0A9P5JY72_9AGAM|nr:hypothetical protein DFH94DRAFT_816366 [Russula ochroleuca]